MDPTDPTARGPLIRRAAPESPGSAAARPLPRESSPRDPSQPVTYPAFIAGVRIFVVGLLGLLIDIGIGASLAGVDAVARTGVVPVIAALCALVTLVGWALTMVGYAGLAHSRKTPKVRFSNQGWHRYIRGALWEALTGWRRAR